MERKLATVLFVDLVGSTALLAGTDPEVARRRVQQYFDRVQQCVISHGGIVEKFAGDAVMAAFGIPQSHEDDAERAVRSALAIMESVGELGLEARIGVESGEVVFDQAESTFATGEAVNIAARLQQAAEPSVILIGSAAHRLTLGCFEVEDEGPVEARGIAQPVWTYRVTGATRTQASARKFSAPLVGREAELELLQNTYARAVRDRRSHLFTIFGDPGVGKSRLSREFIDGLESATVLFGRALPYGEGVTYSALADMVKVAAGIADDDPLDEALEKLRDCCPDEAVADLMALASGVLQAVQAERQQQEIAWAARAWAEKLGEPQPLVLVFEDVHWAEEPLLELIEHLGTWVRNVPLLLLCLARPELLDIRPGWGGGRVRATAIELEPLGATESEELIDALVAGDELPAAARTTLLEKTEGNPLFVEETIRMLSEANGSAVERIPDTLQALIAARIDHLPPGEKSVLQRAAVIGRTFWADAVEYLGGEADGELEPLLQDLLLREFVLNEPRSTISGEDAYRFKHILIREVAYAGLSKTARARHHRRFAEWLGERAKEELLEVRAYHLDQATSLLTELDGAAPPELAAEAADALAKAGRRALAREANATARRLLHRSVELEPTLQRRFQAARAAWRMHDFPVVSNEMEDVLLEARAEGNATLEARALTALAEVALLREADVARAEQLGRKAVEVSPGDESRIDALRIIETTAWWRGRLREAEGYAEEQLEIARRLERHDLESDALIQLASIYTSRREGERAEPLIEQAVELAEQSGSLTAKARALKEMGELHAFRGRHEEALAEFGRARDLFAEVGAATNVARMLLSMGRLLAKRGGVAEAEKLFRESIRILQPLEDRGTLCEVQRSLAEVLLEQGKVDAAEAYALKAAATVGAHDVSSQASTRKTLAMVRAAQGRDDEAEALLTESIDILERSEYTRYLTEPLKAMIQFLESRGRLEDAIAFEERLSELRAGAAPEESAVRIA